MTENGLASKHETRGCSDMDRCVRTGVVYSYTNSHHLLAERTKTGRRTHLVNEIRYLVLAPLLSCRLLSSSLYEFKKQRKHHTGK